MCGIAGKFDFSGKIVPRALVRAMCDTIAHRGPDAEGIHVGPYIGLGERRLSIIDLSAAANPPLSNEDGSIWVVFNGEIYNFQKLRLELEELGHVFRTNSDTEVIVHLYEQYGTDCVQHMRGMFAFAIWDSRKLVLFAARDRLGKKPFFYTNIPTSFLFASVITALTADPCIRTSPNFAAIDSYLGRQYVPSPLSAFSGIFKLPPAHYLLCDYKGNLRIERYWSPPLTEKTTVSGGKITGEILRLLRESVRLRLIADVPVGAFLSGGIDSGAVVALMAMESSRRVKTFSIGFEEDEFNELPQARRLAERYDTDHHEFIVKPALLDVLPLLVRHYNEPFADASAIPTYYVSKMARGTVTVVLSGDGGDENFAGYHHYAHTLRWQRANIVPRAARGLIAGSMAGLLRKLPYTNFTARAGRACQLLAAELPERYQVETSILKPEEKQAVYTPYFVSLISGNGSSTPSINLAWESSMDSLDWMMRYDQHLYLPDCLMVKTDVASMANSLELRCPFLDHKFVEFTSTIPSSMKRDGTGGKLIFKEAVKDLLLADGLRKRKTGFGVPLAKWFRGELSELLKATLLDTTCTRRGLFQPKFLKKMVEEHISGQRDWSTRLWAFLSLEMWFRIFID